MDTRDWRARRCNLRSGRGWGIPTARYPFPQHGLAGGWDGDAVEVEGDGDSAKSPTNINIDVELKGGEQNARL